MRILRFFIVFTTVFFIELLLLGVNAYPTVPLVSLCALSALAAVSLPWYASLFMLVGVSLSAFLHNFSVVVVMIGFGSITMLSILFRDVLEHNLVVQSALVISFGLLFMWLTCAPCLTVSALAITVLTVPCMLTFLQ
jgi:hypothetical protein